MSDIVYKVCPCCKTPMTLEQWQSLRLDGTQDDGVLVLELRTHDCGSTIMVRKGLSPKLQETTTRVWLDACLAQLRAQASRTSMDWSTASRLWTLAADIAETVGHRLDHRVFARLGREADAASIIADVCARPARRVCR